MSCCCLNCHWHPLFDYRAPETLAGDAAVADDAVVRSMGHTEKRNQQKNITDHECATPT